MDSRCPPIHNPSDIHTPSRHALPSMGGTHTQKSENSGSQNSTLAITRRPDRPRSSRFQLSAYFCTLFLVRWFPGLKSFNLIDFIHLGSVSRWVEGGQGISTTQVNMPCPPAISTPRDIHTPSEHTLPPGDIHTPNQHAGVESDVSAEPQNWNEYVDWVDFARF